MTATFEKFFESREASERAQVPIDHLRHVAHARCLHQDDTRNGQQRIEVWMTPSGKFYVLIFRRDGGWEIYQPVNPNNDIPATLAMVTR